MSERPSNSSVPLAPQLVTGIMASRSNSASPLAKTMASSSPITRMLTITVASHRGGLSLADGIHQPRAFPANIVELPQVGLARALSPGGADRLRLATRVRSPLISPRRDGAPDPPASCALQSRRTTNRQARYRPTRG